MYGLVVFIHVIICIFLIIIILIQRGRGSGLVESFSGVESMFGAKTNVFLTRLTTILAVLFMFTCLLLAFFSVQESRSLMEKRKFLKEEVSQNIPAAKNPTNENSTLPK